MASQHARYDESNSPSKIEGTGGSMTSHEAIETSSPSKIEGGGGSMTVPTRDYHKNTSKLKYLRRELRNNSTLAEKSLWNWLKSDQIEGLRFRRQFSIDKFILDFYCPKLKLCIELDGDYHYHAIQPLNDFERDEFLRERHGIHTLHFENKIVFEQPQTIINAIVNFKNEKDNSNIVGGHTPPLSPSILEGELSS